MAMFVGRMMTAHENKRMVDTKRGYRPIKSRFPDLDINSHLLVLHDGNVDAPWVPVEGSVLLHQDREVNKKCQQY